MSEIPDGDEPSKEVSTLILYHYGMRSESRFRTVNEAKNKFMIATS